MFLSEQARRARIYLESVHEVAALNSAYRRTSRWAKLKQITGYIQRVLRPEKPRCFEAKE